MKVNELSKATNTGLSTIYNYIKIGLLHPPHKEGPTKSYFDSSHVERLNLIKKLKNEEKLTKKEILKKLRNKNTDIILKTPPANIKIMIIDKALELFSEKGYDNTKIAEITDSLNIASGTFYRFFSSKEELLIACMDRLPKVLIPKQAWAKVVKEKNYIKRLRNRGYAMMNAFPSYVGILNHIRLLLSNEDKNIAKKAAECLENIVKPLKDDLSFAISQGSLREVDVDFVAYILLGINSIYGDRMLIDSQYSVDEAFAIIEDFVYHAIVNLKKEVATKWSKIEITLINGDIIQLKDLKFNSSKYLYGFYKIGEISFHINDIKQIDIINDYENFVTKVTDMKDHQISIIVSPDTMITGKISTGNYKLNISKIKCINFYD
jgi:AcrR family transcriptional regulator